MSDSFKKDIVICYHMFPHYRGAVIRDLQNDSLMRYSFWGCDSAHEGIPSVDRASFGSFVDVGYRILFGRFYWQPKLIWGAIFGSFDVLILLGNPNFLSSWLAALIAKMRNKKVIFWGHGWLRRESKRKEAVRNLFYGLADRIFVYGERAKLLGAQTGFDSSKIDVVYNSLDMAEIGRVRENVSKIPKGDVFSGLFPSDAPVLIAMARLTKTCKFDLLLEAVAALSRKGIVVNVLIIGDGPEKPQLEKSAASFSLPVHFFGACYDEEVIGKFVYHADAAVSPGKVGLMAMHCLGYGTPVVTHHNHDMQMPEAEAIVDLVTGYLFEYDSVAKLAGAIELAIRDQGARDKLRKNCLRMVEEKWSSTNQARIIGDVLRSI